MIYIYISYRSNNAVLALHFSLLYYTITTGMYSYCSFIFREDFYLKHTEGQF